MGAFDDLIAPTPRQSGGAFDDLIQASEPSRVQAFGYGAADAASFGFGDEGAGFLAGAGAVLSGQDYGLAYRQRVNEARARLEEARRVHPISTMAGSLAGATATFLIPGVGEAAGARLGLSGLEAAGHAGQALATGRALPFGERLLAASAGRGPGALGAQMALGAGQGALYGGLYGAGAADEGNRFEGAREGALWGAGFGAFAPPVFQGAVARNALLRAGTGAAIGFGSSFVTGADPLQSAAYGAGLGVAGRPVVSAIGGPLLRAWRNPRAAFSGQTGMSLGLPMAGEGGAPSAPIVDQATLRSVDRSLGRERIGVGELERRVESARQDPLGRTLADVGSEFSADVDTIANMPGQTFARAQQIARDRASRLPEQLQSELREMAGVRASPAQALDEIRASAANNSDGYSQVLAQPVRQDVVAERIVPLLHTPEMQPALARRFRIEEGRAQLAEVHGEPAPPRTILRTKNGLYTLARDDAGSFRATGRSLHEIKTAIDDELSAAADRRALSPAGRGEQQLLDDYRVSYLNAMDEALPGYGQVRAERGSLYDAERALGIDRDGVPRMGKRLLSLRPEEIARRMRETTTPTGRVRATTDFEREMYRISVADEIIQRIDDYASASSDKVRNVGEVLDRVGLQNRLRAVFGDNPEAIDAFLSRAIERAEMLRRAASWTGNSASARRLTRGGDRFMASLSEAGANIASGNPAGAANSIREGAWHALRGRVLERQNDAYGSALLRNIENTSPEDEAYLRALLAELRRLESQRFQRAESAGREGALGAVGGGRLDDSQGHY